MRHHGGVSARPGVRRRADDRICRGASRTTNPFAANLRIRGPQAQVCRKSMGRLHEPIGEGRLSQPLTVMYPELARA
jgi:hypothetical protein